MQRLYFTEDLVTHVPMGCINS